MYGPAKPIIIYNAEEEYVSIYKTTSQHTCNGTRNINSTTNKCE